MTEAIEISAEEMIRYIKTAVVHNKRNMLELICGLDEQISRLRARVAASNSRMEKNRLYLKIECRLQQRAWAQGILDQLKSSSTELAAARDRQLQAQKIKSN